MKKTYQKIKLGDLISILTDYHANGSYKILKKNVELLDKPNYAVMIRTTNFEQGNFEDNKYINEHAYNFLKKSKVYPNDILMNKIANAGSTYLMPDLKRPVSLGMNLFLIRLNFELADQKYVYYYLKANEKYIKLFANGAATSTITKEMVRRLNVILPDITTQQKIVDIIDQYDQLLDNNRRRIQLLEEAARLLFREWFVYFRFPLRLRSGQAGHEKVKIVDGVPEGWKKGNVQDISKVKSGYAFNSKDWLDEGNPVVKIRNIIGDGTVNLDNCSYIDQNVASKTKDFALKKGDLLIAMTGATVGKVGLLSENSKTAYLNQRVGKFTPKFEGAELVLYCFFMSNTAQNHITNYATGAAQPNISAYQIESIKIIVATGNIYTQFIKLVKPIFKEILNLRNQNQKLSQARDLLLPRLMSGEIEV
jgi:type I restriction enzyme S subunit